MREDESLTHLVHPVSFYWVDLECMFSLFRHYTKIKKKLVNKLNAMAN